MNAFDGMHRLANELRQAAGGRWMVAFEAMRRVQARMPYSAEPAALDKAEVLAEIASIQETK